METINLFVLHRYRLLVEALRMALARHHLVRFVGFTHEVRKALERLPDLGADVLLLDARLARGESRPAIRQLRAVAPELKILPIGLESDGEILECLEAGANGFVPGDASLEDLVRTLRAVHQGTAPCSTQLAASVIARIAELSHEISQRPPRKLPDGVRFTPREQEILQLLIAGRRNKEIAQQLFIALPTVKIHVHKILKKMHVKNRREAVRMALESGLVSEIH